MKISKEAWSWSSGSIRMASYCRLKEKKGEKLKIDELAELLGKSRQEIEEMLNSSDVIELNLRDKRQRAKKDVLRIYE